jgi:transcription antitermination protein NusB
LAVQALYQAQIHAQSVQELQENVAAHSEHAYSKTYLISLLGGCLSRQKEIDQLLQQVLDRPVTELNPVEYAVLRIAVFEWLASVDIPAKVILNEAVELAKEFGAVDGYKYVNGVLDKLLPKLRPHG